jgi:peptide/nickel transport system permease protein
MALDRRRARRLWQGAAVVLALIAVAPSMLPLDPFTQHLAEDLRPPSRAHPCGQDKLGRDVLARLVHGARVSIGVGVTVVGASLTIGMLMGLLAGAFGGRVDRVIMGLIDVLMAFPGLLLAIAVVAVMGPSLPNLVLSLSLLGWTGYARLVRGQVLTLREREFVTAARALGGRRMHIVRRHLVPNLAGVVTVQATFGVAGAILAEGSLSFLGLGVPPPIPSWGAMLADARPYLLVAPHLTVFPAAAIAATVLAVNLLGDRLGDLGATAAGGSERESQDQR